MSTQKQLLRSLFRARCDRNGVQVLHELDAMKGGNTYNYHAGWELGYLCGRIRELENRLDDSYVEWKVAYDDVYLKTELLENVQVHKSLLQSINDTMVDLGKFDQLSYKIRQDCVAGINYLKSKLLKIESELAELEINSE